MMCLASVDRCNLAGIMKGYQSAENGKRFRDRAMFFKSRYCLMS